MIDKKEVVDYLRNRQKAAEIEAKVNGINLWVLVGALAVIFWQLIGNASNEVWDRKDLVARALLCIEALYVLSWIGESSSNTRNDLRYVSWHFSELSSPFLICLQGALLLLPPVVFYFCVKNASLGLIFTALFGGMTFLVGVAGVFTRIFPSEEEKQKFPRPDFTLTSRADMVSDLVILVGAVAVVAEQLISFQANLESLSASLTKQMVLISAIYLLVVVTISRKLQSKSINWTYELETELLLNSVTPEIAIRRIEHRALGPRLHDVMDRFFNDMDQRFADLDTKLQQCKEKLSTLKDIPEQYQAERSARIKEATETLEVDIETLLKDCSEFSSYLTAIEVKNIKARKIVLAPLLQGLRARHETYEERTRSAKSGLKALLLQTK